MMEKQIVIWVFVHSKHCQNIGEDSTEDNKSGCPATMYRQTSRFLNCPSCYTYVRRTNKMHPYSHQTAYMNA
jgi:hypothetical protein